MGSLNQRGDVNAAAIAVYVILTFGIIFLFVRNGFRSQLGYLYIFLFTLGMIVREFGIMGSTNNSKQLKWLVQLWLLMFNSPQTHHFTPQLRF
jgi:hypothetical protein